jgi:hypothetical protein
MIIYRDVKLGVMVNIMVNRGLSLRSVKGLIKHLEPIGSELYE